MEKKLTAEEICGLIKKDLPSTPTIGFKCFQQDNSLDEYNEICNHLKATEELVSYKKIQRLGCLSEANWCADIQKAEVTHKVGSQWVSMGHSENKKLYLYPEEALYLLEMGVLELKYNGLPISTQRAYSVLLEPLTSVSQDCYRVYSQLQANGYRVMRHVQTNKLTKYEKQLQIHKAGIKMKLSNPLNKVPKPVEIIESKDTDIEENENENLEEVFSVNAGGEINMKTMQIFKLYESNKPSNLSLHYDAFLPFDGKSSFKKSYLQLPKVRVVVHRGSDPMPDLKDVYSLSQQYQDDVPIIHAVVFPEFITYYNITPSDTPVCRVFDKNCERF